MSSATSPLRPYVDDGRRTIAKVPPPDSDDEDEVEVIQAFCGRPTRSGRIPRPVVRAEDIGVEPTVIKPVKSSAPATTLVKVTSPIDVSQTVTKPVVTVSRPVLPRDQPTICPTQSYDASMMGRSHASTDTTAAVAAVPPMDLSNLPPGYFVVVEMPSSTDGNQQALYHIFAVDDDSATVAASSPTLPVDSQAAAMANQLALSATHEPVRCSGPVSVNHDGAMNSQYTVDTGAVLGDNEGQSSLNQDLAQVCEEFSDWADCRLSAMRQADGTVVIESVPLTSRVPPLPPWPATSQPHPRQTSAKVVPRFPSVTQPGGQLCGAEVFVERNSGKLSEEAGAQYVDVIVEDCDNVGQEEYVT